MKNRWLLVLLILVLASLACQTLTGGGPNPTSTDLPVATVPSNDNFNDNSNDNTNDSIPGGTDTSTAGFPLPPDAASVTDIGPDLVTFQTNMSLAEVMDFYRDALEQEGYTERPDLTVTSGPTFSMVFDGHSSGKALAVQGVEFGGSVTVTLSLQDI